MSNQSKVTGGEWRSDPTSGTAGLYNVRVYGEGFPEIGRILTCTDSKGDADLIAASKDLREALEALLSATWDEFCAQGYDREPTDLDEVSSRSQSVKDGLDKARTALAKANGNQTNDKPTPQ